MLKIGSNHDIHSISADVVAVQQLYIGSTILDLSSSPASNASSLAHYCDRLAILSVLSDAEDQSMVKPLQQYHSSGADGY